MELVLVHMLKKKVTLNSVTLNSVTSYCASNLFYFTSPKMKQFNGCSSNQGVAKLVGQVGCASELLLGLFYHFAW